MLTEEIKIGNIDCIGISPIGKYENFINSTIYSFEGNFLDVKKRTSKTFIEYYSELLNKGECLFYKQRLIFKKGYEKKYLHYVDKYINEHQNDKIFNHLIDQSNYGIVKCIVELYKNGVIKKENFIQRISKYINLNNISIEEVIVA